MIDHEKKLCFRQFFLLLLSPVIQKVPCKILLRSHKSSQHFTAPIEQLNQLLTMASFRLHAVLALLFTVSAVALGEESGTASTLRLTEETVDELEADLADIQAQESDLIEEEIEIEEAIEEELAVEDDEYQEFCLCDCELAADPEGGVSMTAIGESLSDLTLSGSDLCVSFADSEYYIDEGTAVCDDSCLDDDAEGDDATDDGELGDDEESDDASDDAEEDYDDLAGDDATDDGDWGDDETDDGEVDDVATDDLSVGDDGTDDLSETDDADEEEDFRR